MRYISAETGQNTPPVTRVQSSGRSARRGHPFALASSMLAAPFQVDLMGLTRPFFSRHRKREGVSIGARTAGRRHRSGAQPPASRHMDLEKGLGALRGLKRMLPYPGLCPRAGVPTPGETARSDMA